MVEFGELVTVDPWQAWPHEEHYFTPWLVQQENLDKLSAETGLPPLELEGREMREGGLRADVVAHSAIDDRVVLIENQLYRADFDHLGRTLAYANAFNADIVVWIAGGFGAEHLAAFRWLNEHTTEDVDFFAVQVKVYRIGDSLMAPKFEVLERPNNFIRGTRARLENQELGEAWQFRQDFWEFYNREYPGDLPRWRPGYRPREALIKIDDIFVALSVSIGRRGRYLSYTRTTRASSDLEVRRRYNYVQARFSEEWEQLSPDYCKNRENWGEMALWFHDALGRYRELIAESATVEPEAPDAAQPAES